MSRDENLLFGANVICEVLESRADGYWVRVESRNAFGLLRFDGPLKPGDRVLAGFDGWDSGHMLLSISGTLSRGDSDNWQDLLGNLTDRPAPSNNGFRLDKKPKPKKDQSISKQEAVPRRVIIIDGNDEDD